MLLAEYIDGLRKQLEDRKLQVVAEKIGVSYQTLLSFMNKKGHARTDVVINLDNYLNRESVNGQFNRGFNREVGRESEERSDSGKAS